MKDINKICSCGSIYFDKGRAVDGRRAYRCKVCRTVFTEGLQGRKKRFHNQREGYQFFDSKGTGYVS